MNYDELALIVSTEVHYNLRERHHNKVLIPKTADLNDRDFLVRNVYRKTGTLAHLYLTFHLFLCFMFYVCICFIFTLMYITLRMSAWLINGNDDDEDAREGKFRLQIKMLFLVCAKVDVWNSAADMNQTHDQERFIISQVAADFHETVRRTARTNGQSDPRKHTTTPTHYGTHSLYG